MTTRPARQPDPPATDSPEAAPDSTGDLTIVGTDAVQAGMLVRMAESDRAIMLSSVAATLVVVAIFFRTASPWLLGVFVALRITSTLFNHLTCRAVLRLGATDAYANGYLWRMEAGTALIALSWATMVLFFRTPLLEETATVMGLLALVAVQGVVLFITSFSRRSMVILTTIVWLAVVLRVVADRDPHALAVVAAGTIYQAILLRFGFMLHRQMAASVRSSLVSDVLLRRVSALHATMRAQRDELAAVNAQLTAALDLSIELASHDSLTGSLNRRAFQDRLARGEHGPVSSGRSCLMLLDFDFFKQVNDVHGHAAGDAVLAHCARALRAGLRAGDLFARWGGEEFIAFLPGVDLPDAERTAENLRRLVAETSHPTWPPGLAVTASIGVAEVDQHEGFDAALAAADLALYRAKSAGRNTVISAARLP